MNSDENEAPNLFNEIFGQWGYPRLTAIYTISFFIVLISSFYCYWDVVDFFVVIFFGDIPLVLFYCYWCGIFFRYKTYRQPKSAEKIENTIIAIAIVLFFLTRCHRQHYHFNYDSYYVDMKTKTFHYFDDCPYISDEDNIKYLQGYKIDHDFELCEHCEDWADDNWE